ncbi:unnamed protein product [Ceratitis capitata]|uniref:(Mediterranean fruit fly) hypothetical protein n=1 Tax=Ceratitis capitata TaxID=7213 RepID=A0A811V4A5_CERCA|nr:unnamed protein product [Ceratitis capitata]
MTSLTPPLTVRRIALCTAHSTRSGLHSAYELIGGMHDVVIVDAKNIIVEVITMAKSIATMVAVKALRTRFWPTTVVPSSKQLKKKRKKRKKPNKKVSSATMFWMAGQCNAYVKYNNNTCSVLQHC